MKKILLLQTAFVGDLLLAIPLLKRLRKLQPEARITVQCRKGLGDFLIRTNLADDAIEVDKKVASFWRPPVPAELRAIHWDWILAPHRSPRTAIQLACLRGARKTAFDDLSFRLLPGVELVARPSGLPDALRQLSLLSRYDPEVQRVVAAAEGERQSGGRVTLIPDLAQMRLPHFQSRSAGAEMIFLAPGSVWATKRWQPDGYRQLALRFSRAGYKVVTTGTAGERALCQTVIEGVPGAENRAGELDIYQSCELFAQGRLLLSNDSGAMHMAAVAGLANVAVFGPTTLDLGYQPWQQQARVVQIDLPCRPCGKHGAQKCPIGTHACMQGISVDMVLAAAADLGVGI